MIKKRVLRKIILTLDFENQLLYKFLEQLGASVKTTYELEQFYQRKYVRIKKGKKWQDMNLPDYREEFKELL